MNYETAFTMDTSSIKFGPGTTREVGHDMKNFGATRVLVMTDPGSPRPAAFDLKEPFQIL